ncbi:hypothetical protein ACVWY3_003652 [Bradyrhizobium sp. USDA 4486]
MLTMLAPSAPRVAKMTETTPNANADRAPAVAIGRQNQGIVEEGLVEIREIHPVLVEIGLALRFVPNDLHRIIL